MALRLRSTHPDATAAVGRALATVLIPGDVVVLTGPLGAGKTRLVQGIAAGLEVPGRVTSPTFVLVRRHAGRLPLVHVDAYRLTDAADLGMLDDDVLAEDVVTCVEWGGNVAAALPTDRLDIELTVDGDDGEAPRGIVLVPRGTTWDARALALAASIDGAIAVALTPEPPGGHA